MKVITIKILLLVSILHIVNLECFSKIQDKETTKNNITTNEFDVHTFWQIEERMSTRLDREIQNLERNLQVQKDNLSFKESMVDRWLTTLAIIFTAITIVVSVVFYIVQKSIRKKVDREFQEAKERIDEMISNAKDRIAIAISHIESKEEDVRCSADKLRKMYEEIIPKGDTNDVTTEKFSEKKFLKDDVYNDITESKEKEITAEEKELNKEKLDELHQISNEIENSFERKSMDALTYYLSKDYKSTLLRFRLLLENKQDLPVKQVADLYYYIAYIQCETEQYEESNRSYDSSIKYNPQNSQAYNAKGLNYIYMAKQNERDYDVAMLNKAKSMFEKSIKIKDNKYQAFYNLGYVFILLAKELGKNNGDIEERKNLFQKAYDNNEKVTFIQPDNLYAHDRMGCCLGYLADLEKGHNNDLYNQLLEEALKKCRFSANAGSRCYNYACFLALQGKKEEAFYWLEKALQRKDADFSWIDGDEDWEKYRNEHKYIELQNKYAGQCAPYDGPMTNSEIRNK